MAAGADTSLATGEGDHHLTMAVGTPHPGKTEVKVAAAEKLAHRLADDWSPRAVTLLISLAVHSLEVGIVPLDNPIKRRGARPTRPIDGRGIGLGARHENSPFGLLP